MRLKLLIRLVLVLVAMPATIAWADDYQDTVQLFENAGESGTFFDNSHGYAVFPTIAKGGSISGTSSTMVYVSWGVALAPLLIFSLLIYRWVGTKPRTCDFMIATEGEMKKVNWPSRKEVVGSTWIVICCVFLMAALLFGADFMFSAFFRWIKILDLKT